MILNTILITLEVISWLLHCYCVRWISMPCANLYSNLWMLGPFNQAYYYFTEQFQFQSFIVSIDLYLISTSTYPHSCSRASSSDSCVSASRVSSPLPVTSARAHSTLSSVSLSSFLPCLGISECASIYSGLDLVLYICRYRWWWYLCRLDWCTIWVWVLVHDDDDHKFVHLNVSSSLTRSLTPRVRVQSFLDQTEPCESSPVVDGHRWSGFNVSVISSISRYIGYLSCTFLIDWMISSGSGFLSWRRVSWFVLGMYIHHHNLPWNYQDGNALLHLDHHSSHHLGRNLEENSEACMSTGSRISRLRVPVVHPVKTPRSDQYVLWTTVITEWVDSLIVFVVFDGVQ